MTSSIVSYNQNFTSNDINSLLNYPQQDNFSNKKEWLDIYKKHINLFKNEEKNLINTYLSQDFHLSKLYKNSLEEESNESQLIRENIKVIKGQINEAENIFKGVKIVKNKEIRTKINKLEDIINQSRLDFKYKFENLLNEEEVLEKEIKEIQIRLENDQIGNVLPENIIEEDMNLEKDEYRDNEKIVNKIAKNNYVSETITKNKGITFEKIIEQVENDKKYYNHVFSMDDIIKFSDSLVNLEEIKEKINFLENKILEVGGPTQGWENKDHQEFLKLRTQYKYKINTLDFLSDLENYLPYITRNELKIHINLFIKYDKLNNLKKVFIERYKTIKDEQDQEKKQVFMEKVDQKEKYNKIKMKDFAKNIEEKKKQVEEWKKMKEIEQSSQQQAKMQQESVQKEKDRQKFQDIIEKNKIVLDEYYKKKEFEKFQKDLQDDSCLQSKKVISEIDLERIREKNLMLEEKRKLIVKSKSIKSIRDTENYKKYQIKKVEKMANVESKLDFKTVAVTQKQRKKHDFQSNKDALTMANNVLGKTSRAIPEWRKSIV